MTLVILPNTLFDKKYLKEYKDYKIIIWEHPHYFKTYNYNKKKLMLHRATMKYYYDYLKENKFKVSKYFCYKDRPSLEGEYTVFDPIDNISLPGKNNIVESPNFLGNKELYEKYNDKTKNFFFNAFYMFMKKELDILPKVKSQDKLNRDSLPDKVKIPSIPSNKSDIDYIKESAKFVEDNFSKNYGNCDNFIYPIKHKTAKKWLKDFIDDKLKCFGQYQDAIIENESYLFHSILSSSINIGLINPIDIIDLLLDKKDSKIPLNSLEGYIRQLFWREYQRYCYIYYPFSNKNYFNNRKKLTDEWYEGTLGILPVDDCIKKGFDTGYLHHIERLMVVGNYMCLSEIQPCEGFKWFMEFSIDSYLWVMHQNVLHMVFFTDGKEGTMRKPYLSSSNYVLKMSNYPKGEWVDIWTEKYRKFVLDHKKELWPFRYHFPTLRSASK